MDANVIAAIITLGGSAAMATTGALAQWYKQHRKKRTVLNILQDLHGHPVMLLESDKALQVKCHDPVKADLLDAIRKDVVCAPTRRELMSFLLRLRVEEAALDATRLEECVLLLQLPCHDEFCLLVAPIVHDKGRR